MEYNIEQVLAELWLRGWDTRLVVGCPPTQACFDVCSAYVEAGLNPGAYYSREDLEDACIL